MGVRCPLRAVAHSADSTAACSNTVCVALKIIRFIEDYTVRCASSYNNFMLRNVGS